MWGSEVWLLRWAGCGGSIPRRHLRCAKRSAGASVTSCYILDSQGAHLNIGISHAKVGRTQYPNNNIRDGILMIGNKNNIDNTSPTALRPACIMWS